MLKIIRKILLRIKGFKIRGDVNNLFFKGECFIKGRVFIDLSKGGSITLGDGCILFEGLYIATYGGHIVFGDNCSINPYCVIYGHGGLKIGNNVRIASHTSIIPSNHNFSKLDSLIKDQGETKLGISISDDVWIGSGVRVLDGVNIGKGAIIGAGSVVTKDVVDFSVNVGVPSKKVKSRYD
jgi:acetyltransferase-like isoleucine patch superfamily enzyme